MKSNLTENEAIVADMIGTLLLFAFVLLALLT